MLAIILVFLTLLGAFCNVGFGLLIKATIDTLSSASKDLNTLIIFSVLFVSIRFLTPMVHGAKEFVCSKLSDEEEAHLRHQAFRTLHNFDHDYQVAKNTGDVIRRVQVGLSAFKSITRALFLNVMPVALDVLLIIGIVTYFFGLGYAAVIASVVAAYLSIVFYFTNRRMSFLAEVSDTDRALAAFTHDSYLNQESVRLFIPIQDELNQHWQFIDRYLSAQQKSRRNLYWLTTLTSVVSALGCLLILIWGSLSITHQMMTIGGYLMLTAYLFQIFLPLNSLGLSFRQIKKGLYDMTQMKDILDLASVESERNIDLHIRPGAPILLRFEDLSLQSRDGSEIFTKLQGTLHLNGLAFVVGKSGIGKSSIVRMLCGLTKPSFGRLTINGYDCQHLSQESIRANMAIASQDVVLFNSTLKQNLLVANPNATDDELLIVLNKVGLGYLFDDQRGGLDCQVGERGQKMSGGEKQRISLARALLKSAPLIILDEPTAALDSENTKNIRLLIDAVAQNACLLVITHDTSLIKEESDNVYELSTVGLKPIGVSTCPRSTVE
ncbi:ABC transporter, transmembrane region, ATP binding component [Azotobacter vinelandii CA]|uniref:ABC transporter, transmembrane region, ATP binding component n=3 Tax=Pseudomonadota TaxID=1224 RepID=C1DNI2_AZOVD|nr:ABC transporter, transmembrane region, ATP binding component [Azotobacter vinelandii DJ]AGK15450.1 ABC transporter, transmembrane region, ATP binding component [Azotobacter vinelandii CA]AGK19629.1 ABC transporter, transmembrane region, ATP binding component [Azotobacter vinelandii CA6]